MLMDSVITEHTWCNSFYPKILYSNLQMYRLIHLRLKSLYSTKFTSKLTKHKLSIFWLNPDFGKHIT